MTAICQEFCKKGAKVVASVRADKDKALAWQKNQKDLGYEIGLAYVDVTQFESCAEMAKDVETRFGGLDILVNCAGTINDVTLHKMTPQQWSQVVHTDLDSMFNVTRQFITGMIERGYGRIINISSVNGEKGQFGQTNYSAAKSGVHGFTMAIAQEVARKGITVNTIAPGYIATDMVMSVPDEVRDKIVSGIPLGRLGKPEEIAALVNYLASDVSGFMTGAELAINVDNT